MAAIFFDNDNIIGNIPTITPFAIYVGNCHLASLAHALLERSELGLTIVGRVGSRGQHPLRRVLARAGMSRQNFTSFSLVASSLPPLPSGMVKTSF